ncbi:MAG TPA: SRPBCC domain-containing protein, partial [Solirubrobacteraceae bacterium]|nr:SRPBCC domain-containing protein [Solirubrobacteraceae bacterium]
AITEPSALEVWFPTGVAGELRAGGHLTFSFEQHDLPPMEGDVTEFEPPSRLAFWWGEDHLRFELAPVEGGTQTDLRFTVLLGAEDKAARDGAGWHVCLDRLDAALDHRAAELDHGINEGWREIYDEYERRGFPATAPIPRISS